MSNANNTCKCDVCETYKGNLDLYYGLAEHRRIYLEHLEENNIIKPHLRNPFFVDSYTIDSYNNWTWLDNYVSSLQKKALKEIFDHVNQIHDSETHHNVLFLKNSFSEFEECCNDFGIIPDEASTIADEIDVIKKIRRACKFGIVFAKTIHFVLDGFNPEYLLKPREHYESMGDWQISITSSELRFIFRHWDTLKGKIIFYKANKKLNQPPWEIDASFEAAFSRYKDCRSHKMDVVRSIVQLKDIKQMWDHFKDDPMEIDG